MNSTLITSRRGFQESNSGKQWGYAGLFVSLLLNMRYTDMQQSGSSEIFTVRSSVEFCCHLAVSHVQAHPAIAV